MAGSFSQELEDLLNPQPRFADPEDDDHDEATKAKVIDGFAEEDDEEEVSSSSALRKNIRSLLSDTDSRYTGKRVSRQQLLMDIEGSDSGENDDDEEGAEDKDEDTSHDDDDDDDDDDDEEEEEEELEDPNEQLDADLESAGVDVTFPQGVDLHKLTDGMDDLGVSEDDEDSGEEELQEDDEIGHDDDDDDDDEDDDEGTVRTFSQEKVDEEVEKGKAVKNQLALWDQLLEGRIKIQKALVTVNQLPQPDTLPEFKERGGAELGGELKNAHKALKALQRSLLELHDQLLYQKAETRSISLGDDDDDDDEEINSDESEKGLAQEGGALKRKLEMADYPNLMAKRFAAFQPYRDATLQKWQDKTRLTMGKNSKSFGAFDRNILAQLEQVLMDKERLVRRTQIRRSEFRILGKKESPALVSEPVFGEGEEAGQQLKANTHLKDQDEDIFDDDDFYHQLLRELIERKTSSADPNDQVAMGRQWLAIQKLRSKIKKKVDTKASKGRKVRFQIHSKLMNFMAPVDQSSMGDEARSELYRSLFGQTSTARE